MSMTILGLATAAPAQSIAQSDAARIARTFLCDGREARLLSALFQRTQVRSRGSVLLESGNGSGPRQSFYPPATGPSDRGPATALRMQRYAEDSLPLAAAAAARSLELAATGPEAITHLITVSCTGFYAPGIDIGLVKRLGLSPTVARLHVGFMGCHGVLNALQAARATVLADPASVVLLCAVELCSLHYQYGTESDALVANALFADGAAALVGRASAEKEDSWRLVANGTYLLPDSEDGMSWKIGNHGFEMTLSSRVPELIGGYLRPWLEGWLAKSGRSLEEVNSWAIHPGGPRILTSVAEALRLPQTAIAASAEVLAGHGNMSSPTILFVLKRLQEQGVRPPCVVLGFGPGLVAEAALLE